MNRWRGTRETSDVQKLLQSYKAQVLVLLFIWLVSMLSSAAFVLSLSMIGLVALALFELRIDGPEVRLGWRRTLRANWQRFFAYKPWPAVTLFFFIVLVSALWSSDWEYTLERLRIKLPFLVLPFAFASMPRLERREIFTILYFLVFIMFALGLYVFIYFLADYEHCMEILGKGGHLPTPSNHIRFSLTVALSILAGVVLFHEKFYLRSPFERHLVGFLTLFLFGFIHLLSVRSGIAALYIGLLVLLIYYIVVRRKYLLGVAAIAVLFFLPLVAYHTLPTFRIKVDYARWDYLQFKQGIGGGYTDSERLVSMQVGWRIFKQHPLLGVGAGDLKREVQRIYDSELAGRYNFRMPHNQFITVMAGSGLLGLLAFLTAFFLPLCYRGNYRQPLFAALHAVIFMSFLMENTIENNFGVSLYLFFLLTGLNYLQHDEPR